MSTCRWYVLHAYSGYEKKVADNILDQASKLGISEHIEDVSVPTQNIVEVKRGVRVNTERKIFPGYILIKMNLNDDTWHMVKSAPKVLGFVGGSGDKPIPLGPKEAENLIQSMQEGADRPKPKVMFEPGEVVRITDGPFNDFNGVVEKVDFEKNRLKVSVLVFGKPTPIELSLTQVEKG